MKAENEIEKIINNVLKRYRFMNEHEFIKNFKKEIIIPINKLLALKEIPINVDNSYYDYKNKKIILDFVYIKRDFIKGETVTFSLNQLNIDEILNFDNKLFEMKMVNNISEYLTFLLFDKIYKEILELDKESISVFNKEKLLHEINIYLYENEIIRANYLVTNKDVCINTYPVKEFIQDNTKVILYEMKSNN